MPSQYSHKQFLANIYSHFLVTIHIAAEAVERIELKV